VILFIMMTGKKPFEGNCKEDVLFKISRAEYNVKLLETSKISEEGKDFIKSLLCKLEEKRMDINKALEHPWITKSTKKFDCSNLGRDIIDSLKTFTNKSIFQKEVLYYIARISNEKEIQKLRNCFMEIDKDNTGTIEYEEVFEAFKNVGIIPDPVEVQTIWENMDFHNDGKVNYSEFLAATISSVKFSQEEKLWTVFKFFDNSGKGYITFESVCEALRTNNIAVNERELKVFFEKHKKTKLHFENFKSLVKDKDIIL